MGKLLLIVLAVIVAFMVISLVISALHFLFFVGLVVLLVLGALCLTSGRLGHTRRQRGLVSVSGGALDSGTSRAWPPGARKFIA